ncbi:hypothetical protein Q5752_003616 [Cryptotrichosporon argae]
MSTTGSTPVGRPPSDAGPTIPPTDLVASLPAPILRLLVLLARPIALLRAAIEVALWKPGRRVESWMLLLAWWSVCLGAGHAFKFLLPPFVFLPLVPLASLRLKGGKDKVVPATTTPDHPVTSDTLLLVLADLHTIYATLPPSPLPAASSTYARFRQLGAVRLTRGLLLIWAGWVGLGYVFGFRVLLALCGTLLLLTPSPPLAHLVVLLARSLAVRRALALLFLFTFGSPPAQRAAHGSPLAWLRSKWAASRAPASAFDVAAARDDEPLGPVEPAGDPIYFRFEVHENQRWWMGLDWTSALLPNERPSWCDSHLLPAQPPPSFSLPSPSAIVLPAPTKSDPNAKVRRTASWKWVDDDWSIVRTGQGAGLSAPQHTHAHDDVESVSSMTSDRDRRLSGYSASGHDDAAPQPAAASGAGSAHARAPSMAEQAFAKGLERLKARTAASPLAGAVGGSPVKAASELKRGRTGSQASEDILNDEGVMMGAPIAEHDDATDPDGWVYGDNKWESMTAKGGLGKFTRRRRWQRRAVCTETVTRVSPADPDYVAASEPVPLSPTAAAQPTVPAVALERRGSSTSPNRLKAPPAPPIAEVKNEDEENVAIVPPAGGSRDDVLRLRLKKVMGNVGG